ncbi:hypothetical protein LZ30DRAFT_723414 [Colletotrichum cereale]|nr:hypothetical protein LZ30DRAFT_723414 [Colletotrichum cereale]
MVSAHSLSSLSVSMLSAVTCSGFDRRRAQRSMPRQWPRGLLDGRERDVDAPGHRGALLRLEVVKDKDDRLEAHAVAFLARVLSEGAPPVVFPCWRCGGFPVVLLLRRGHAECMLAGGRARSGIPRTVGKTAHPNALLRVRR